MCRKTVALCIRKCFDVKYSSSKVFANWAGNWMHCCLSNHCQFMWVFEWMKTGGAILYLSYGPDSISFPLISLHDWWTLRLFELFSSLSNNTRKVTGSTGDSSHSAPSGRSDLNFQIIKCKYKTASISSCNVWTSTYNNNLWLFLCFWI